MEPAPPAQFIQVTILTLRPVFVTTDISLISVFALLLVTPSKNGSMVLVNVKLDTI